MASPVAMTFRGFPQEIWWLIVEQAANSREASTLLLFARLSRAMACFALPRMYGIPCYPACRCSRHDYIHVDKQSVSFWRSIIVSSFGRTLYPYCCWINTIDFSDLLQFLKEMDKSKDGPLRQRFYSPPLRYLQLLKTDIPNHAHLNGNLGPHVLFCEVVNKITEGIKATVDQGHVTSRLANIIFPKLEYLPSTIYIPVWISRLTGLRVLHIHDAGLLNEQVTLALAQNCPALEDFLCTIIPDEEAEKHLTTLLQNLPPNTLECFTISWGPIHGQKILKALDRHSGSLKCLGLAGMGPTALGALNQLRNCNAMEALCFHASDVDADFDFARSDTAVYDQCVEWLQNCSQLTFLGLRHFPSGTQLLKDSLTGPKQLRLLVLTLDLVEASAPWYTELQHQAKLKKLMIKVPHPWLLELGPASGRCQGLAEGISRCPELIELETEEYLSVADINKISEGALKLENISFSGTLVHDAHIMPLANLPRVKEVRVTGDSSFTASGILRFFEKMEENADHDHRGFSFSAAFQQGTSIGQKENKRLCKAAKRAFGGNVDIQFIDSDGEDYYFQEN